MWRDRGSRRRRKRRRLLRLLNVNARRRGETLPKLYNYSRRVEGGPYEQSHQVTSVRNVWSASQVVLKFKMSHLIHHPKSHHDATTSIFQVF